MFYVSEEKIYSAQPNAEGKYTEYKLQVVDDEILLVATTNAISKRPEHRQVCTVEEVIAQLGSTAIKPEVKAVTSNKSKH